MFKSCYVLLLLWLSISFKLNAQNELPRLKISLLTCSPGEDLYSIFGHTAIRVVDSTTQTDVIFNYGTFDFYDPNFYPKFIRGKLNYFVSTDNPNDFFVAYNNESRNITEQVLNIHDSIKFLIKQFLYNNALPQHRNYKYDFLFNNCTTKIRDLLKNFVGINFNKAVMQPNATFRNAIHYYLDKTKSPWNKLGIDVLLGSKIDRVMTIEESNFLPENLLQTLNQNSNKLSYTKEYPSFTQLQFKQAFVHPLFFFATLALALGFCSIKFTHQKWCKVLVKSYVFITGLVGILLLFMWFFTDHQTCANNYNLLWCLPTNIIAAFAMFKHTSWRKQYFFGGFVVQNITIASWFFLPQEMNIALLPIVLLNCVVYFKQLK